MTLNPEQLLKRFSTHLRNAVAKSMTLATSFGHSHVSPIHLLLAMIEEAGSIAAEILKKHKAKLDLVAGALLKKETLEAEDFVEIMK